MAFGDVVDLPDRSPAVPGHFGGELGFDVAAVELDGAAEEGFGAVWGFVAAFSVEMAANLLVDDGAFVCSNIFFAVFGAVIFAALFAFGVAVGRSS